MTAWTEVLEAGVVQGGRMSHADTNGLLRLDVVVPKMRMRDCDVLIDGGRVRGIMGFDLAVDGGKLLLTREIGEEGIATWAGAEHVFALRHNDATTGITDIEVPLGSFVVGEPTWWRKSEKSPREHGSVRLTSPTRIDPTDNQET